MPILLDEAGALPRGRGELRGRLRQHRPRRCPCARRAGHEHPRCAHGRDGRARGRPDACRRTTDRRGGRRGSPRRVGASAADQPIGRELAGATVGLVGFGRIGRRVAELLRGFEVRLLVTSRSSGAPSPGVERRRSPRPPRRLGLRQRARATDAGDETPDRRERPGGHEEGAILVNTSRGAVVDTTALIHALRSGHLGAAGLDVYENEPHVPADLRELHNTVLLPHVGSATAADQGRDGTAMC